MKPTLSWFRALALGATLALAGCGNGNDPSTGEVELRVADQLQGLQSVIAAADENRPDDYRIEWANFVGGPPIIAAQTGGSIDLGWMAETPLIFAQAAGSPVKVVAVSKSTTPEGSAFALVVKPDSPIRSVADLKGKSVAYMQGTVLHYMVARLLDEAGLSLKDINSVQVTGLGPGLLEQGSADALTLTEPYLTQLLDEGRVRVIATGASVTPGFTYLVASDAALSDPGKAQAIGDFVARAARATRWQRENVAEAAPALAQIYKVTPELATQIIERSPSGFVPIDDTIIAAHQQEADLFRKIGLIRSPLNAAAIFDHRYDDVVAAQEDTP